MSDQSGKWFSKVFKNISQPKQKRGQSAAPRATPPQDLQPGAPYKKGDVISGKYEVHGILGKGGFGVVYLIYSRELKGIYALKTFQDEFIADQEIRTRFRKEANIWMELGRHPYIVRASLVDEISGRLFIIMEYIAPDEKKLNTLEGYLQRQPPNLAQSLRWAIQICRGMEYAYSKGVRAHRDLKPANIMISQDKTAKITDFGLAGVMNQSTPINNNNLIALPGDNQTLHGVGFGTPTHMPPEQFDNAAECDERSDIYSFGIVLYEMATGGRLPFAVPRDADWRTMQQLHRESPAPRLESPLFPIIQRCLEKSPDQRYQAFEEARRDLELLLMQQTGEVIVTPKLKELEEWEWDNKGFSLHSLGRYEEALLCHDKAIALNPRRVEAWNNKGNCLNNLGRYEEALGCLEKALEINPHYANAWNNKANALLFLGRHEEAIPIYDKAIELDPGHVDAWNNKGSCLHRLRRDEEAIRILDRALEINPYFLASWMNKGNSLGALRRYEEALHCYSRALELDPGDIDVWFNKALTEDQIGHFKEAAHSYQKYLELAPASHKERIEWTRNRLFVLNQPGQKPEPLILNQEGEELGPEQARQNEARSINDKGANLDSLGHYEEAIQCYDQALELDPLFAFAWNNKGNSLNSLGRNEEAIRCFDKALELDPRYVNAWNNKGDNFNSMRKYEEAIICFDKALELDPCHTNAWNNKGNSFTHKGNYKEAILCYDRALELDPRHRLAWTNKGKSLYDLNRHQEAIRCFDKALEIDPRCDDAWYTKANSLAELGRHAEAVSCYDKALEINPRRASAWSNKGNSLHDLGRDNEAISSFKKALEINPREEYAWNGKGISLDESGRYQEAIRCYDKAIEIDPHYLYAWFNKGNTFRNLKRNKEALQCYDQALKIDVGYAGALCNKALAEDDLGESNEAVGTYKQFLAVATPFYEPQIKYARKRLRELGGK